jgi:hypothetical protein
MDNSVSPNGLHDNWIYLNKLANIIKHESRYVIQEPYKSFVDSIMKIVREQFTSVIPANSKLYRARINEINFENRDDEKKPFPPEEMDSPPYYIAKSGRINPEGISYFYCAGELDTAGAELRPWKGAYLTIGEVEIRQDISIADLTLECEDDDWKLFFYDFADMFSIQWPSELNLNYLVTQYFAEHFKSIGLRGVKYKSEFNNGGNNYSLFYKEDYAIVKTYSVETSELIYFFYENKPV